MAELLPDGTTSFALGQDAWTEPDLIQPNQYAKGINVTTRGGALSPRFAWHSRTQTFESGRIQVKFGYQRTLKEIWVSGKFQALVRVQFGSDKYLITVICGLFYLTNIKTFKTVLLSETVRVNETAARINWTVAAGYIVFYDWPSYPVIVNETNIRRANPEDKEIPISTLGAYSQFRLLVADAGVQYAASDQVGNLETPDAPISFNELLTPNTTFFEQWLSLPVEDARMPITAMGTIQQLDTSTGIGPMFLGTAEKVYYAKTNDFRSTWGSTDFAKVLLDNAGIAGQRAFVNVNSDVILVTPQAQVHAFSTARNEAQRWGNVPMSVEVSNFLRNNGELLNGFTVCGYFANHIFISANIFRTQALTRSAQRISDYAAGGFVVLELDSLSTFLNEGNPVWAGLWTGVHPMDITSIDNRCFVISKDGMANELYEVMPTSTVDKVRGNKRQITSIVYTAEYTHGNSYQLKKERSVAMHLQDLKGKVEVFIEKLPTHAMEFIPYGLWKYNAAVSTGRKKKKAGAYSAHQVRELVFGGDDGAHLCSPITQDLYNVYAGVQFRLTFKADYWKLKDIKINADIYPHDELQEGIMCESEKALTIPQTACDPDWKVEADSVCQ